MSTTAAAGGSSKPYTKFSSNGSPISSPDTITDTEEYHNKIDTQIGGGGIIPKSSKDHYSHSHHHHQGIIKITRGSVISVNSGTSETHLLTRQSGHHQMNQNLPSLKPELLLNDTGLFTVYCFIKNFIG